jgi:hypothetical protein
MPKPAKKYLITETEEIDKALKLISFPLIRARAFCEWKGEKIEIPKEALFRQDDFTYFETFAPNHQIIEHSLAFNETLTALTSFPYRLKAIMLDQCGASLAARFEIDQPFVIVENPSIDLIKPEIILTNSYNKETALGLLFGFSRPLGPNTGLISGDFKCRWFSQNNKIHSTKIKNSISLGLKDFSEKVVPIFIEMGKIRISKALAIKAIIYTVQTDVLPKKLAKHSLDHILHLNGDLLAWSILNALLWSTSHVFRGTPNRLLEIQQKIAKTFRDGGKDFLVSCHEISDEEAQKWIQKTTIKLVA